MPQAIAAGIIAAVGATGAVATAITVATYAISVLGSLALSNAQKRKSERAARSQYESSVVDRMINVQSAVSPRDLVLGRTRKGGAAFFQTSIAPHNAVFVSVLALAGHEIDGVEQVYFNETPVDLDEGGNVTTAPWGQINLRTFRETGPYLTWTLDHTPKEGTLSVLQGATFGSPEWFYPSGANSVPYTLIGNVLTITEPVPDVSYTVAYQWEEFLSSARVYMHLGSPDQAADARMQLLLPGTWTDGHRARGVAYIECEFVYNDTAFPTGLPNVTARIRGAKCYDPRTGLTQFTENPAIMQRHVLMHPQFGKRKSITAAEDARIVAAANSCDIGISYTGADWVPMYRAAIVVPFGAAARDVLDDLAQSMGGEWAYAAGEFYCRAGVYQAPVLSLTDADLAVVQRTNDGSTSQSPIGISPHRPRAEKINTVAARIWDQAAAYLETPLAPFKSGALIAADGAELSQEVTMPAVFYGGQAFHICGIMLRDGRDPLTVTLPFKMRAYPLELFDGVTLTLSRYGWTNKEFRILNRTFMPDGYVMLTLKETTSAIFQFGAPFLPDGLAPNTGLPKPWEIDPPVITSISSGEGELIVQTDGTIVNVVRVAWEPVQEASILEGGTVEVQYQVLPDGDWISVVVPGTATEARIPGLDDLAVILIRARTRSVLAKSAWGPQVLHQVIGKTEPPPNIENLSVSGSVLSWSMPRRVPDLAGFVFRFHYGNNLDWNSAVALHTGVLTESPYDLVTRPGGLVTIMGKAIDTSGNMSLGSANIIMNLGDPPIANIVEEFNFRLMGWPTALLYLAEDDYLLTDGYGNYLTDEDGNYLTTGFGPIVQTANQGWTEIDGVLQADALDSFYGDDNQSFYGEDFDSFYETGTYGQMVYVTDEFAVTAALAGSIMTLTHVAEGTDLRIEYRFPGPGSFYGNDNQSFYAADDDPFYGPPGPWQPWPGQIVTQNDAYQFRVTIGSGTTRGILRELIAIIDAPDMEETLEDVLIDVAGTVIPYTKQFTSIKTIQATLQANASGAVTVETDKTLPLAPKIRAFDDTHALVGGATADLTLKGY